MLLRYKYTSKVYSLQLYFYAIDPLIDLLPPPGTNLMQSKAVFVKLIKSNIKTWAFIHFDNKHYKFECISLSPGKTLFNY